MKRTTLIFSAVLLAGCCCGFPFGAGAGDPYAGSYTQTEPDATAMLGVWKATADSVKWLKGQGYDMDSQDAPTLEFKNDGTFVMSNMPDCWWSVEATAAKKAIDSGSGKWEIGKHQEWWCVKMNFDTVNGKADNRGTAFMLCGEKAPYTVHITVGDPDSGDCIEFEKQ